MKVIFAAILGLMLLVPVAPALAKVCYHCKGDKPFKYVCSNSDTFVARKNARAMGCDWTSYSSTCECGAWVSSKSGSFVRQALALFPHEAPRERRAP